jgi:hypothetical protein
MSTHLPYRKSFSVLLMAVVILQGGCRGWIEKPIVPDTGITIPERGTLRVTMKDGTVVSVRDSFITADSIVGVFSAEPLRRAAIARTDVTRIEVQGDTTPQGVRIAANVYLWVLVAGIIGLAIVASQLPH